jgi:hypothetical protein
VGDGNEGNGSKKGEANRVLWEAPIPPCWDVRARAAGGSAATLRMLPPVVVNVERTGKCATNAKHVSCATIREGGCCVRPAERHGGRLRRA